MSGLKVIPLQRRRRVENPWLRIGVVVMLLFVIFSGLMFIGMVSAFVLTRAAAGGVWPPAGQPWFPVGETMVNTVALLASGALVFRAARAWQNPEARIGPLLLAAIALGLFFVFFQGFVWYALIRQGLTLSSSHHGQFFYLIMGMYAAHALAALVFMGIAWLRLKPLQEDGPPRGSLSNGAFSAAQILWYFVVGTWPVLCLFLYF